MTDTAVTPFPGVSRRKDSTRWAFVLRAPQDLLHRFDGKPWAVRCSLGTSDLRQANDKARALHAEWATKFAEMRLEDNPQKVTASPALAATVAAEVYRWVLQADDNMRDFPGGPRALLAKEERQRLLAAVAKAEGSPLATAWPLEPGPGALAGLTISGRASAPAAPPRTQTDPLDGIPEDERQALARFNARADAIAKEELSGRKLRAVLPLAEAVTKSMGMQADWTTPEGRDGLLKVLNAYRQGRADAVLRDAGEAVETPPQQQPQEATAGPQSARQGHSPRDAFDAWAKEPGKKGARPKRTVDTYRAAADMLAALVPGRPLESLTREDGVNIVAGLTKAAQAKGGKAQNTAVTRLSRFKTLLAVALDLGWTKHNALHGRKIHRVRTSRKPWKPADLVRLFDDPIFTAYALPRAARAGADAAYWLPLLGLFTGARITELAQLGIDDLAHTDDAGWCLSIHEEDEGQSVKNEHSVRTVPVHPELVRLGLMDYWKAVKDAGAARLWPAVVFSDLNGAGGEFSKHFGKFKTAKGFGPDLVFHSFRHTLETELRALSVPKYHIAALAGHAAEDVSDGYAHPTPAVLRPVLERLQFPGLALPRVFKVPAWKPEAGT